MPRCGFSRASGFDDFRDRFMEQLAVGSKNILGVGRAMSDLCIEIGSKDKTVMNLSQFHTVIIRPEVESEDDMCAEVESEDDVT